MQGSKYGAGDLGHSPQEAKAIYVSGLKLSSFMAKYLNHTAF